MCSSAKQKLSIYIFYGISDSHEILLLLVFLEGYANSAIAVIFCLQVTVVSLAVASLYILQYEHLYEYPYIFPDGDDSSVLPLWLEMWFTLFILFNNFIPISLYVTLEMVNIGKLPPCTICIHIITFFIFFL